MTIQTPTRQFQFPAASTLFAPLQREFDRLLEQFGAGAGAFPDLEVAPRLDMRDTKDGVEITVELPGIADEDVKVTVEDNVLTIRGEKKAETERKELPDLGAQLRGVPALAGAAARRRRRKDHRHAGQGRAQADRTAQR
jgi:HSP20 family molecular chaperone IbpA